MALANKKAVGGPVAVKKPFHMMTIEELKRINPESLTLEELKQCVRHFNDARKEIEAWDARKEAINGLIVSAVGIGGKFQFDKFKVAIIQAFQRRVPWKEVAVGLAKKLYDKVGMRKWLVNLARTYKKTPNSAYARVTVKDTEVGFETKLERAIRQGKGKTA